MQVAAALVTAPTVLANVRRAAANAPRQAAHAGAANLTITDKSIIRIRPDRRTGGLGRISFVARPGYQARRLAHPS